MSTWLELLWWPSITCLILTGMHGYLGLQVIRRNVIFLDLALAQWMGLSGIVAVVLHAEGWQAGLLKGGFVMGSAGFLTWCRTRHKGLSQELLIGLLYVGAMAASMALISRFGTESHHLHDLLVGNLLVNDTPTILKTGAWYAGLTIAWAAWRQWGAGRFPGWVGDYAFYVLFAVVVNSSVGLGGVLLVFAFLIAPAATATLWARTRWGQLGVAWGVGTIGSIAGMMGSLATDTPPAAAIVLALVGLFLVGWALTPRKVAY